MNLSKDVLRFFRIQRCAVAALMLVPIMGLTPQQSNAEGINWTIAPYLWATDVGLDVTINNNPAIGASVPFNDLVDKLDGALMGHIEMSGEKYGAFADIYYVRLTDDAVIPIGPGGPIFGDLLVDTDLTVKMYELGGFYRMGSADRPGSRAFDLILGVRQVDIDLNLDMVLPGPGSGTISSNANASETDIFVGARLIGQFSQKWHYKARADYGSGGTEGTLNALAAVGYTFGKTGLFSIDVGYRYLSIELKKESNSIVTETDMTMSGPLVGFVFNF